MAINSPANKAEFQAHLRDSWTLLQQTLNAISAEQLTERRDHVGWTAKDHLAHLVAWERGIIALLKKEPRYAAMGLDATDVESKQEDALNQILRAQHESASLSDVRNRLRETHDELTTVVDALEPDALLETYSHYQPDEAGEDSGEPVLRWVIGNSSAHYLEHLPWIRQLAGGSR